MNLDLHEVPPAIPALKSAEPETEREAHLIKLQRELEEVDRKLKETEQIAHEAAIAASIEAAYKASIPGEVMEAAREAVVKHLEDMRDDIEKKLLSTESLVLDKLRLGFSSSKNKEASGNKKSKEDKESEKKQKIKEEVDSGGNDKEENKETKDKDKKKGKKDKEKKKKEKE
ncbi:hypothetical protein R1sor_004657 [Riccia sorocarpa]|uniref:Uncharacterized protein n=1 Tax=Riccia sorocarpa TaxID=122646 RepID=A0ABD3HJA5_9MARC